MLDVLGYHGGHKRGPLNSPAGTLHVHCCILRSISVFAQRGAASCSCSKLVAKPCLDYKVFVLRSLDVTNLLRKTL